MNKSNETPTTREVSPEQTGLADALGCFDNWWSSKFAKSAVIQLGAQRRFEELCWFVFKAGRDSLTSSASPKPTASREKANPVPQRSVDTDKAEASSMALLKWINEQGALSKADEQERKRAGLYSKFNVTKRNDDPLEVGSFVLVPFNKDGSVRDYCAVHALIGLMNLARSEQDKMSFIEAVWFGMMGGGFVGCILYFLTR